VRLSELANAPHSPDPDILGLTADSRAVKRDFLFAALSGEKADGALFIPQAEKSGAAAVLAAPGVAANVPVVHDALPRKRLAQMAGRFYGAQPRVIAGITGTNGKTSTARFAAELWRMLGRHGGSLGTLGASAKGFDAPLVHTTPEPVMLHQTLAGMSGAGVTHLAMEVSSHGLAQHRADGVRFALAAFTNITQDHLDYHASFEDYFNAKLRLFTELLDDGASVVVNMDGEGAGEVCKAATARGLKLVRSGERGVELKLVSVTAHAGGLDMEISAYGRDYQITLPLIGAFQAENALLAAGVVIASGEDPGAVMALLATLNGVPGRMQKATQLCGASIYVDYAHTPGAIATALRAIRPHLCGRLIAIIGAGGDRDRAKRSLMGEAALAHADIVIVTDDNPRTEDAALIRRDVLASCPGAREIGDRKEAIAAGVALLKEGDVLLIAGKGHETGQMVGTTTLPFNDAEVAKRAAAERLKELGR